MFRNAGPFLGRTEGFSNSLKHFHRGLRIKLLQFFFLFLNFLTIFFFHFGPQKTWIRIQIHRKVWILRSERKPTLMTCPTPDQGFCRSPRYLSRSSSPGMRRRSLSFLDMLKQAVIFLLRPTSQRTSMLSWVWLSFSFLSQSASSFTSGPKMFQRRKGELAKALVG